MTDAPRRRWTDARAWWRGAGHLAVWPGLYFVGAYWIATALLGRPPGAIATAACLCAGISLYLLDRVKPRDSLLDPADLASHPERHAFLRSHRRAVRAAACALGIAGSVLVARLDPRLLLLPLIGLGGIVAYSAGQRGSVRLKDRLVVKNALPGLAIASLAVVLALQAPAQGRESRPGVVVAVLLGLGVIVTLDAALCDISDREADLARGTRTLPSLVGVRATWLAALAGEAATAAGVWAVSPDPARAAVVLFGGSMAATTPVIWILRPLNPRDLVDLRLPAVAALVLAAGRAGIV